MNKNLKKIMVSTMFSVASLSAIGCGQSNKIMAKNELKNTQQDLKEKTKELADTVSRLRDEIDTNSQLSSELSELRNKYYNLNNDYSNLKNDLMIKNDSIAELRKELEFFYPSLYEE